MMKLAFQARARLCRWAVPFLPTLLLTLLLLAAGPARAGFTNCAEMPQYCCFGIVKNSPAVCSSHGSCIGQDLCACFSSFEGAQCETEKACGTSQTELITCSGGGTCRNSDCWCDSVHSGVNCAIQPMPQLLPAALAFGAQAVGAAGDTRFTTLSSSYFGVSVTSIALGGANAGDFLLDGGCAAGTGLAVPGRCEVGVRFAPTAPGPRSATLSIVTSASALPLTVALSGSGTIGVENILVDPATATTLYAALDGAGVYVSTNSGGAWTAATTQPASPRVKALVIKPGDSAKLFAATYGGGVFKSTNNGVDWTACANTNLTNLNVVSLSIDATGKLYAGTEAGVFVSVDNCASWNALNTGLPL
jgi:hypothetical protein